MEAAEFLVAEVDLRNHLLIVQLVNIQLALQRIALFAVPQCGCLSELSCDRVLVRAELERLEVPEDAAVHDRLVRVLSHLLNVKIGQGEDLR